MTSHIPFYFVGHHTNQLAPKIDYMRAWNYMKIDFDQETGQEYSTIVQIIVKADRGKAIAWRSPSCKMTRRKNSLDSQSAFCTQSAVYIMYLVYIFYPVCSLHFVLTGYVAPIQFIFGYSYLHNTYNLPQNTCVRVNSTFSFFSALILHFPFVKM